MISAVYGTKKTRSQYKEKHKTLFGLIIHKYYLNNYESCMLQSFASVEADAPNIIHIIFPNANPSRPLSMFDCIGHFVLAYNRAWITVKKQLNGDE